MRKLFVIFGLLVTMFVGCAINKPAFHSRMPADSVYIDPYNSWINQCPVESYGRCGSPWRSVTIRVINTKYRDVSATVKCMYMPERVLFGEQTAIVKSRNDAMIVVWGTARMTPGPETVRCKITDVR
jgi:hypothetical protein